MKILKKIYSFIKYFILRCIANDLSLYAAQASFFIIISAIPFLMLLLSFIQYIFPLNVEETIDFFIRTVPREMNRLLVVALYEIYPKSISAPLISVTALTALWSASRGMLALRKGLNGIADNAKKPVFYIDRLLSILYTIAFVAVITATLLIFAFGNNIIVFLSSHFPRSGLADIMSVLVENSILVIGILMTVYFSLMYKFLVSNKTKFVHTLPGALFSAAGWILFSYAYGYYINNFSSYSYVYGSLAAVVLLMLWLYFCMNILLIGAELNEVILELRPEQANKSKTDNIK